MLIHLRWRRQRFTLLVGCQFTRLFKKLWTDFQKTRMVGWPLDTNHLKILNCLDCDFQWRSALQWVPSSYTKALARYSLSVDSLILINFVDCLQNVKMMTWTRRHLMSLWGRGLWILKVPVHIPSVSTTVHRLIRRSTDVSCGAESASGLDHNSAAELPAATSCDTSPLFWECVPPPQKKI